MMNIVQLHDRIRFWIDTVASTRFESSDIDLAINNAVREIVDEKYDHSRLNHRGDAFQKTQRVRDELRDLVKTLGWSSDPAIGSTDITYNNGSVLIYNFPTGYNFLLAIAVVYNNQRYNCVPLSYDQKNVNERNPFRRVQTGLFPKLNYIESESGITIQHPFGLASGFAVYVDYLSDPTDVFYGYEKGPSDSIPYNTPCIASLTPTVYNGTTYISGQNFTTSPASNFITQGLVTTDWVDPSINGMLHEEIAKRAAANCLLTSGNYEKYKAFKAEVLAT